MAHRDNAKAQLDLTNIETFFTALELGRIIRKVESLASKEGLLARDRLCSVQDIHGVGPAIFLEITKHIQREPVVDMLLGADAIDRLLHLGDARRDPRPSFAVA